MGKTNTLNEILTPPLSAIFSPSVNEPFIFEEY
jgi:hypothetical protein